MSATTGRAPVARTSASWSGLRMSAHTSSPRALSSAARRSAICPWPPAMTIVTHEANLPNFWRRRR